MRWLSHDLFECGFLSWYFDYISNIVASSVVIPGGITCQSVGIKDINLPEKLTEAMSKQAQAERERLARVTLGTAETEIAVKFEEASKCYQNNPVALQLRGMNMLFEGLKEKGSLIIVPGSALDSMNLSAIVGLTALAQQATPRKRLTPNKGNKISVTRT